MKGFVASSLLTVAAANNVFNAEFNRCMDIKTLCIDDTDTPGCQRQDPHTAGANLQLWDCENSDNQNFQIVNGRLRNTATGLCLDVPVMCLDGTDTPGCETQHVGDVQVASNVKLWTCREDDAAGISSTSFGSQKWDLLKDGSIKNEGTGLCLTADGGKYYNSGRNLFLDTCGLPGQTFDYVWKAAPAVNAYSSVQVVHPGYIVGSLGFIVAAVALIATRRRTPVVNEVESVALNGE
jgi:hypothetical protein